MSDKEFDKKFQDSFENFEFQPSRSLWPAVADRLENKKGRKSISLFWIAAASITIILISGLYLLTPKNKIWLYSEDVQVKVKQEPESLRSEPLQLPIEKKEAEFKVASGKPVLNERIRKAEANETEAKKVPAAAIDIDKISAKIETHESHPVNKVAMVSIPAQDDVTKSVSMTDTVFKDREIIAGKPRIKSVGDLVNFVIAKVDQREDKIIEMSDNDEGSSISAINLGVFKIKAGKNKAPGEFKVNFK